MEERVYVAGGCSALEDELQAIRVSVEGAGGRKRVGCTAENSSLVVGRSGFEISKAKQGKQGKQAGSTSRSKGADRAGYPVVLVGVVLAV